MALAHIIFHEGLKSNFSSQTIERLSDTKTAQERNEDNKSRFEGNPRLKTINLIRKREFKMLQSRLCWASARVFTSSDIYKHDYSAPLETNAN